MVDVSKKEITSRTATAEGRIFIPKIAYDLINNSDESSHGDMDHELKRKVNKARGKGDVLTVAQLAGIMAR